jgi:PEP-CTERM motif
MNKLLIALATAAVCIGSGANATTLYDFSTPSGLLGTTQSYTNSGLTITAGGFGNTFSSGIISNATALYGKNDGGDEKGLGLANDNTGEHEIEYGLGFVQLNVSALFGKVTNLGFTTGSTTDGEKWAVYGSNTSGVCGSAGYSASGCGTFLTSGTTETQGTPNLLPSFGTYTYYDFVEISHVNGSGSSDLNNNFLLSSLTGAPVPEPATWSIMLIGFAGIGFFMMRSRRKGPAATA